MNKKVDFPRTAYPISNEVLEALEQFEQQELSWLSGYCAGLAKGRQNEEDNRSTSLSSELPALDNTSSGASSLISDTVATVQILYASQTGNAKAVAENLFDSFKNNYANNPRLEFGIENTNSFKPKSLASKQLLILVASTHGEGEPPDDAIEFLEQLKGKVSKIIDVQFFINRKSEIKLFEPYDSCPDGDTIAFNEAILDAVIKKL